MAALDNTQGNNSPKGERIAKVIARSGLCSRRDAEALIEEGRVSVNGAVIESAALDVQPDDTILVDRKPLPERDAPRLWRYYKPKGRVTTHKDPEGRPTVFEALPEDLPRLISVGRLDFNTEGLLLLTNDGELARHLELPSTGWARRYRVRAHGHIDQKALDELADGLVINRIHYGPIEASLEREQGDNVWITLSIREGKNREVRRIMEHLGLTVNRLIRVSFGPFMLGELEPGQVEEIKTRVLKDQLGPRLSKDLGVRREIIREDKKLAPAHGKATYLRRKPEPVRPVRVEEERPLRRRRILPLDADSGEEAKVEFVAEKRPKREGFGKSGGEAGGRERGFRGEGAERPARFDSRPPREGGDRPPFRERGERGEGRPRRDDGEGRPSFRPRREDGDARPSFRPRREDGDAPRERRSFDGERSRGSFQDRPEHNGEGGGERPAFDPLNSGTMPREERPRREGGDRPPFRERGERSEGRPRREGGDSRPSFRPRGGDGEGRPSFRPRREDGEGRPSFRPRREDGEGRPSFRPRREDGEGRPSFRPKREDGDDPRQGRSFDRKPDRGGSREGFRDRPERTAAVETGPNPALYDPSKKPSRDIKPRREGGDRPPFRERSERGEGRPSFRPRREDGEGRPNFRPRREDGEGRPSFRPKREDGEGRPSYRPRREDGEGRPSFRPKPESGEGRPNFRPKREDGEGRPNFRPRREDGEGRPSFRAKREDGEGRPSYRPRREDGEGRPSFRPRREDGEGRPSFRPKREDGDARPSFRAKPEGGEGRPNFRPRREDGEGRPNFRERKKDGEGGSSSGRSERGPGQGRRDGSNFNRKPGGSSERGTRPEGKFRSDRADKESVGASRFAGKRSGGDRATDGRPPFKDRKPSGSAPKGGSRGGPKRPRSNKE